MSTAPETFSDTALIARAILQLGRRLRAERPASAVTISGLGLLSRLHQRGPMTGVELAKAERLQPQSLSRLITRLEADRLIARNPGEADRRTLVIAITPAGRRVLKRDMDARRAWLEARLAEVLTPDERARLSDAAALMLRVAGEAA